MEKSLFRKILFFISVPKCVACGERLDMDETGLCKSCFSEYREHKNRACSRCSLSLCWCTCANAFLENHYVKRHIKVFRYIRHHEKNTANSMIYSLKRDNRDDVAEFLASELAESIRQALAREDDYTVTSVPRRRKAIVRFGIDHAELLARKVAKKLGLKYKRMLVSLSKKPQKSLVDRARISNAEFKVIKTPDKGERFIIIDDIVTTGASLGSCAALLHAEGAGKIIGASLAVAYKDKYTPFAFSMSAR